MSYLYRSATSNDYRHRAIGVAIAVSVQAGFIAVLTSGLDVMDIAKKMAPGQTYIIDPPPVATPPLQPTTIEMTAPTVTPEKPTVPIVPVESVPPSEGAIVARAAPETVAPVTAAP